MIRKEGVKILISTFFISFIFLILSLKPGSVIIWILFWIFFLFFLFSLWFFRDPNRLIPQKENSLISPADGKVILIDDIRDDFVGKGKRIAIFMSIINVHVNRIPCDGIIRNIEYMKGKFLSAFKPETSVENERNTISIESEKLRIKVVQIAGIVARRIVSYLSVGDEVQKGDRFGMIMFGSRVEILVPENVRISVNPGEKVKSGETTIGEIE